MTRPNIKDYDTEHFTSEMTNYSNRQETYIDFLLNIIGDVKITYIGPDGKEFWFGTEKGLRDEYPQALIRKVERI